MNNSYRLGNKVPFNAKAGRFGDNQDAYEHFMKLHAVMRDGVGVPEDGAEYTVGPWLTFDPETERHTGEHADEANQLLKDSNRPGFEIPAPQLLTPRRPNGRKSTRARSRWVAQCARWTGPTFRSIRSRDCLTLGDVGQTHKNRCWNRSASPASWPISCMYCSSIC